MSGWAVRAKVLASARSALGTLNAHLADGFSTEEIDVVSRWLRHVAELAD